MTTPYLSEIRAFSFNFAPKGWALCNGQTLPIQQYQALFSLLGTSYGGNGVTTFQLPNLQGAVPLGWGSGSGATYQLGEIGGEASHTLLLSEMPMHTHIANASATVAPADSAGVTPGPATALAQGLVSSSPTTPANIYGTGPASLTFAANALAQSGGNLPHPNQQPFLVLNFCIALSGIFPSRG